MRYYAMRKFSIKSNILDIIHAMESQLADSPFSKASMSDKQHQIKRRTTAKKETIIPKRPAQFPSAIPSNSNLHSLTIVPNESPYTSSAAQSMFMASLPCWCWCVLTGSSKQSWQRS